MAGSAPDYDNERLGGPSGLRYPLEVGKGVFLVQPDGSPLIVGAFNATTAGSGIALKDGTQTYVMRGNADDGGKVFATTGNAYLFSSRRLLLTKAQVGNNSFFGGCDRLSINADESGVTGVMAAHWGMLEVKSGGTIGGAAGVGAVRGDINNNGVLASGGVESCFLGACEKVAGTHTGVAVTLHVPTPQSGVFDALAYLTTGSGVCNSSASGSAANKQIFVYIDGTKYALNVMAVGP